MKFSLKKLTLALVLVCAMVVAAGAASFEAQADALNSIGLFAGTDSGYQLDSSANRDQAAAMLVRLLGKTEEANALWEEEAEQFPFTDLQADWAKPSIYWLYKNGLAAGTSETTFAPAMKCNAQQYATFLLRALGYSDAAEGDFTYANAIQFATEKGVVDEVNTLGDDFTRDNMVAMSYTALATDVKDADTTLLAKLIADGAVADDDASKALTATLDAYNAYMALSEANSAEETVGMKMAAKLSLKGETEEEDLDLELAYDVAVTVAEKLEMSMVGGVKLDLSGAALEIPANIYLKDDVIYIDVMDSKMKVAMPEDTIDLAELKDLMNSSNGAPITMIDAISCEKKGKNTVFTITFNNGVFNGLVETVLGAVAESAELDLGDINFSYTGITATQTFNDKGVLTGMTMDMGMTVDEIAVTCALNADITTGAAVKFAFPADLDEYIDAAEAVAAEEAAEETTEEAKEAEETPAA